MAVRNIEDRRVRKTKKQLRTAITSLLLKKDLESITVRDVAELADVNRGTFYAHYRDVGELLRQLEEELFEELRQLGEKYRERLSNGDAFEYLTELFKLAEENGDIVYALYATTVDMPFQYRLYGELKEQYISPLLKATCPEGCNMELVVDYVTSGLVSVVVSWLEGGKKETPQELARLCGRLITRGIADF